MAILQKCLGAPSESASGLERRISEALMLVLSYISLLHIHVSTYAKNDC